MSQVFIWYKRDDEGRVASLIRALEQTLPSLWWDRSLPGGENWQANIQQALDTAKCVIVVWTANSIGPSGDFVRDEARQAKLRGILVPVSLDKVDPPLGFGEIQAVDLTRWKGNASDPFFQDLVAAVTAKLQNRPVPLANGPKRRLMRRLTYGSVSAVLLSGLGFGLNVFSAQDQVCGVSLLQPSVSDGCGALGMGHRATKEERLAWERRDLGSCQALRTHITRFPDGAFRDQANALLSARRVTQADTWTPTTRRMRLVVARGELFSNKTAAETVTLAASRAQAEGLCKGFAATTFFRYKSASLSPQTGTCAAAPSGVACGFDGDAVCDLDERRIQEYETCAVSENSNGDP